MFQPEIGSGIYETLFEPLDYATAGRIRSEVIDVIGKYEPRIDIQSLVIIPDYDNNGYSIELSYVIIGREDTPIGIEFFLERTR